MASPRDPRLATRGSTHRHFAEDGVVPIALEDFAKLVVVALPCDRGARGHHVPALEQELRDGAGVVPLRLQRFDVRLAGGREHLALGSAAVAVLVGEPGRGEERPTVAAIPEHARAHDGSPIPGEICPRIVIDVGRFLPVAAAQQRGAPAARQTGRKER